jgi:hypothetical protein
MVLVDPTVEHQEQRFAALFGAGAGSLQSIRETALRCLDRHQAGALLPGPPCPPAAQVRAELSELDNLSGRTSNQVDRATVVTRSVPVTVLTAVHGAPGGAQEMFHRQLAALFRFSIQQTVVSSHLMMIDHPDVVSAAILRMPRTSEGAR